MFHRVVSPMESHVVSLPSPQNVIFNMLGFASGQLISALLGPNRVEESPFSTPPEKIDDSILLELFGMSIDALAAMLLIKSRNFKNDLMSGFEAIPFYSYTDILDTVIYNREMDSISVSQMLFPRMRGVIGESISSKNIFSFDIVGAIPVQALLHTVLDDSIEKYFPK